VLKDNYLSYYNKSKARLKRNSDVAGNFFSGKCMQSEDPRFKYLRETKPSCNGKKNSGHLRFRIRQVSLCFFTLNDNIASAEY